jgi:hypothetical protein
LLITIRRYRDHRPDAEPGLATFSEICPELIDLLDPLAEPLICWPLAAGPVLRACRIDARRAFSGMGGKVVLGHPAHRTRRLPVSQFLPHQGVVSAVQEAL